MRAAKGRRDIDIVTAYPGALAPHYFLHHLASAWAAAGHRVRAEPLADLPPDSIGLLHIDRTQVAPSALPKRKPGSLLLNERVLDISKRLVSRQRLAANSDWQGPVIVKTDANHHGLAERGNGGGALQRLLAYLPWRLTRRLPDGRYPILPRLTDVPDWVWRRGDLIVERFTPEREGRNFALRIWLFFGRRNLVYRIVSPDPLVKAERYLNLEVSQDLPPPAIVAERDRLGFDFGKLDYVVHQGEPILLDANKTPAWAGRNAARVAHLAGGLEDYLERAG